MTSEKLEHQVSPHQIVSDLSKKLMFATPEEKNLKTGQLQEALLLSMDLHKDQRRKDDEPYIQHILRVTKRLTEEYGVTDADVIIAALLHDSVEDQSAGLSERAGLPDDRSNALSHIRDKFGERVSFLVENLSNEEIVGEMSDDEWNEIYASHIKKILDKDFDLLLIKLSDFSDNALKLDAITDASRRLGLSKKYLPTMQVFLDKIREPNALSTAAKVEIVKKLEGAISETEAFISSQN